MEKQDHRDHKLIALYEREKESRKREQEDEEQEQEQRINRTRIPNVDIYLHTDRDWYSFKASSNSINLHPRERRVSLKPALPPLPESITAAQYADLGSFIFVSGGLLNAAALDLDLPYNPSTNKVFYIDTLHPEEGWKAAPPMTANRYRHIMLADAGKIYVLGGLDPDGSDPTDGTHIFAEVFDPLNPEAGWKPLARVNEEIDLPRQIDGHMVLEYGEMDRKILFYSYYHKSLFYLSTGRQDDFGIYDANFGKYRTSSVSLGVTFFYLSCNMYAYDILDPSSKAKLVQLLGEKTNTLPHSYIPEETSDILLSLGNGYLALIWMGSSVFYYDIHCSIIHMSRFRGSFVGKVVNYSSHSVKSGGWLRSGIAVWRPEEDVCLGAERDERSDEQ